MPESNEHYSQIVISIWLEMGEFLQAVRLIENDLIIY